MIFNGIGWWLTPSAQSVAAEQEGTAVTIYVEDDPVCGHVPDDWNPGGPRTVVLLEKRG